MSVIIINPNSTVSMTEAILAQAQRAAPHQSLDGWTSHGGPPSIQGVEDGEIAKGPLLQLVDKASKLGADGIIIGCFDDTALDEAVALSDCPVIGIGQAA
jgi:allantoin racemase